MAQSNFRDTGKEAEIDGKRRICLGPAIGTPAPGIRYRILRNDVGQILLDPVRSVPAYEAWVYDNPERLASILKGIAQAEDGLLVRLDLGPEEDD